MPSPFNLDKFKCYTDIEKVGVILSYVMSALSTAFSIYKLRVFARERAQKLHAAGIKPTFKRLVFLERTLANHCKLMLLRVFEKADARQDASDGDFSRLVSDLQRQLQEQQQQQQQTMQQLQQQLLYHQQQLQQQQQEVQQLRQRLHRDQQ